MSRVLTGDKLVESVRNRAMIPNDTSLYTDENILDIANEEIDVQLLDKLLSLHEEHLTVHIDIPRNAEGIYDIPYRAVGNKVRDITMVTGGTFYEMTQISIGELPDYTYDNQTFSQGLDKFYVESNQIKMINNNRGYDFIRVYFYIRPNVLVLEKDAGKISRIVEEGDEVVFKFDKLPNDYSTATVFDIVGASTPNKIKCWDIEAVEEGVNVLTAQIRFKKEDVEPFLGDIKEGDYVCQAEESPVPNLPTEMHPVLAQLTAVHILEAMGDTEALGNAQRRLERMNKSVMSLVDDRVELAPKKIRPRNGVLNESRGFSYRRKRRGR
jgi:hypothetical protein